MMMNQQQQQQVMHMNQSLMSASMNQMHQQQPKPPQMVQMNGSYRMWPPQHQQFRNPNSTPGPALKPPLSAFNKSLAPRNNWKGKKMNNKVNGKRSLEQKKSLIGGVNAISGGGGGNLNFENFNHHVLNELQHQNPMKSLETGGVNVIGGGSVGGGNMNFENSNRSTLNKLQRQNVMKTRNFFPKRKFNKNNSMNTNKNVYGNHSSSVPFAPRNTTSFIIRSKKSGGVAPLVSPCPVTPAVLPTPVLSPSRELLVDMAKEEWGVDGYGSMKGLIRLRSPGHEMGEEEDGSSSSESDVEEHAEMERRLDHDLSRFEMIYDPNSVNASRMGCNENVLENRVDGQDAHIARLEKDNSILKERLFLMERELGDLRRRMGCLESMGNGGDEINEGVVENESENDREIHAEESHSVEENNEDFDQDDIQNGTIDKNNIILNVENGDESKNEGDESFEANRSNDKIAYMDENAGKLKNKDSEFYEH